MPPMVKSICAYFRFLSLKYGLMSNLWQAGDLHGCYNQTRVRRNNANDDNLDAGEILADDAEGLDGIARAEVQLAFTSHLTAARRKSLNTIFANMVCLLAYMFRTRGHHWKEEYNERYMAIWRKTATAHLMNDPDFKNIMTVGLHAIPPVVLDEFYEHCVNHGLCDAVLVLRYNSLAAGTAVYGAVMAGVRDLKAVFPGILEKLHAEVDHIEKTYIEVKAHRWAHSVNARFYGQNRDRLAEENIGAVAALIKAAVDSLAPDHDLVKAKSLQRVAKIAPITGAAYARAIREYIATPEFHKALQLAGPAPKKIAAP